MKKTRLIVGVILLSISQLVSAKHDLTTEKGLLAAVKEAGNVGTPGMHRTLVTNLGGSKDPGKVLSDAVQKVFEKLTVAGTVAGKGAVGHELKLKLCEKELDKSKKRVKFFRKNIKTILGLGAADDSKNSELITSLKSKFEQSSKSEKAIKKAAKKALGKEAAATMEKNATAQQFVDKLVERHAGIEKAFDNSKKALKTTQEHEEEQRQSIEDLTKQLDESKKTLAAANAKTVALGVLKAEAKEVAKHQYLGGCTNADKIVEFAKKVIDA